MKLPLFSDRELVLFSGLRTPNTPRIRSAILTSSTSLTASPSAKGAELSAREKIMRKVHAVVVEKLQVSKLAPKKLAGNLNCQGLPAERVQSIHDEVCVANGTTFASDVIKTLVERADKVSTRRVRPATRRGSGACGARERASRRAVGGRLGRRGDADGALDFR